MLYLSPRLISALLDPAAPHLALLAVWARCRGHGPEARRVVDRALELTRTLPQGLRDAQKRAIVAMLNQELLAMLFS